MKTYFEMNHDELVTAYQNELCAYASAFYFGEKYRWAYRIDHACREKLLVIKGYLTALRDFGYNTGDALLILEHILDSKH